MSNVCKTLAQRPQRFRINPIPAHCGSVQNYSCLPKETVFETAHELKRKASATEAERMMG
jgi:hypothetical protein